MFRLATLLVFLSVVAHGELQLNGLPPFEMKPEKSAYDVERRARYFDEAERTRFQLHFKDGIFVDYKGRPVNTRGPIQFVIAPEGHFYSFAGVTYVDGKPIENVTLYHSSFLAGGPVLMAGLVEFNEGVITYIDNESGHYMPRTGAFYQFLSALRANGIDFNRLVYRVIKLESCSGALTKAGL